MHLKTTTLLSIHLLLSTCNLFSLATTKLFPDKLRCVSRLLYEGESYIVEEYVDRTRSRSSTRVQSAGFQHSKTYLNQLSSDEDEFARKFVMYNENKECDSAQINDWILSKIRQIHIDLLPESEQTKHQCDVAIGPSALLLLVEKSLDQFRFVRSSFHSRYLIEIDSYEFVVQSKSGDFYNNDKHMLVNLLTNKVPDRVKKEFKTLNDYVKFSTNSKEDLTIYSIEVCQVKVSRLIMNKLDLPFICDDDEIVLNVDYQIITEMSPQSLDSGSNLDDRNDFYNSPFLLPIGVGCFQRITDEGSLKYLAAPVQRFSGLYITSYGTLGASYVAYDGQRNLLRLDRDGRKSIYDLERGLSYNIYSFDPSSQANGLSPSIARCIVLETDSSYIKAPYMFERLLGISISTLQAPARHLGSRNVDHNVYEVYETELLFDKSRFDGYNLPILLEPMKYIMPNSDAFLENRERFFITYYVSEYYQATSGSSKQPLQIIRYMELHKYNQLQSGSSKSELINRVEFIDFNWSFDVEPVDEDEVPSNLFALDACAADRSQQLLMSFSLRPLSSISHFKMSVNNAPIIKDTLHQTIAKRLEISDLNVASLEVVSGRVDGNIEAECRIIDLIDSTSQDSLLGYAKYLLIMYANKKAILSVHMNRHNLVDCKLDSLASKVPNAYMFCPGLTTCILFTQKAINDYRSKISDGANEDLMRSMNQEEAVCEIHRASWAQLAQDHYRSTVIDVVSRMYKLKGGRLQFSYPELHNGRSGRTTNMILYEGEISRCDRKKLNAIRNSFMRSPLLDLRYSTIHEESDAPNMNYIVDMNDKDTRMQHCQKACQLDDYCQSFSLCFRDKGMIRDTDCILSTLRLTDEQVEEIAKEAARDRRAAGDRFEVRVSTNVSSQVFRFYHDQECSLHSKDFTAMYNMQEVVTVAPTEGKLLNTGYTVDKCAEAAYDVSLWSSEITSTFTYCPLSSGCFLANQPLVGLSYTEQCFVYHKSHLLLYDSKPFSRLAVKFLLRQDTSSANENPTKLFKGVSIDECARDCTLRQSKCLAFDFCQPHQETTICILYSIRSPLKMHFNRDLLPIEKPFYSTSVDLRKGSVELIGDDFCSHLSLKFSYFDLKFKQLRNEKQVPQLDKINKIEDELIKSELEKSDKITLQTGEVVSVENPAASGWILGLLLLLGFFTGCICTIYGKSVYTIFYQRYINPDNRDAIRRISQLTITNHLEL